MLYQAIPPISTTTQAAIVAFCQVFITYPLGKGFDTHTRHLIDTPERDIMFRGQRTRRKKRQTEPKSPDSGQSNLFHVPSGLVTFHATAHEATLAGCQPS